MEVKEKPIKSSLSSQYLKDLVPQFNSIADALISKLSKVADGKTVINMVDEFQKVTLDVIAKVWQWNHFVKQLFGIMAK